MPASSDLVSIDHAKGWAKRLHKSKVSISTLSSAQEAVAVMLGHASWHALDSFYKNTQVSDKQDAPASLPPHVALPPGTGAVRVSSTEACDMESGPCACGSWHDDDNPPARLQPIDEPASEVKPFDDMMQAALEAINRKYPTLNGAVVEAIAHETEELKCRLSEMTDKALELENEGHFPYSALEQVLEENTVSLKAPPGNLMIRVKDAKGQAYMTILSAEEYGVHFKPSASSKPKMR
jgi:hypothetical protein